MSTQKTSQWLFRIFAALAIFALFFTQSAGVANAQGTKPPTTKEKVEIAQTSLDEVQNYYGRLGDIKGPVGIVVELKDKPAALVYAESQGQARSAQLTVNQVNLIAQKQADFMSALQNVGIKSTELFRTQKVYNGIWLRVDSSVLKTLATMPGVKAIHPIVSKQLEHTTSVPLIGAPQVWGGLSNFRGENITIGIIDTGVDYIHTNFGGPGTPGYAGQDFTSASEVGDLFSASTKVVGGWDFVGDAYNANDAVPVLAPDPDPMDCNGHGSHVAGSAAGFGVNADGTTYVEAGADTYATLGSLSSSAYISKFRVGPGVAPKASLYALRVFGCAGSTDVTEQAIEWAMDPNGDSDLSDHLDVINMSLGSSFGSEYDTSAAASNNAAEAGVIVVTSAGNSGDVYYITGAPGVARYAINVANSVDSGAVVSAMEATAPAALVGNHPAVEAAFGPDPGTPGVTGDVLTTTPANGCTAISTVLTGKIALIDRGACTFKTKVRNAQNAGAIGVIIANNVVGFPFGMGDDPAIVDPITIPSMMTTLSVGNAIKAQLTVPATVTIRLTSEFKDQFQMTDTSVEDTLVASSSRGPARVQTLLKPDLAAPGDSIFSTATGTGDKGVSFGGTSMASPHVAGVMALLRQNHPTWSVAELKALVMNTAANDIWTSTAHTAKFTPTRVGAGRVSAANATQSSVVAYNAIDPGQVSVAFGEVEVLGTQSITKSITIKNKSATTEATYTVAFDSRYQANPGLTFTILDAYNVGLDHPITIPPLGTVEIRVKVDIDAALLTRGRDGTIATGSRQRFSESGGYVTFTPVSATAALRVPVHIAARPASDMSVSQTGIVLPAAATGTFSLTPTGTPVDTVDDTSLVTIMELLGTSPNDVSSTGPNDAADLKYIGATSDYPFYTFANSAMYFGVATYGKWDTANATEFDVYIDINEDSVDDFVVFNATQGFFTGTTDDVMFTAYCNLATSACNADYYVNGFSGATNTNLFHNNVMYLPVNFTSIGLVDGVNTDFNFQIVSFNRDAAGIVDTSPVMSYDVASQAFTAIDPVFTGMPTWLDASVYSPTFDITYNKAAVAANNSKGLLLLHHFNATNTAEVLPIVPNVTSIVRANANPVNTSTADFTVTFSEIVTGVDLSDFALVSTGVTSASLSSVSGSGTTYTVTVNTGSGNGTLHVNLIDNDSILDADLNPLGGTGTVNGDFTTGETYSVVKVVTFADVPNTHTAWQYIERLYISGITGGCGTGPLIYCPGTNVTRAQMAVFILRAEHGASYVPPPATGTVFTDVPVGSFGAAFIEQLKAEGITSGCTPTTFCPNATITRGQMAVFLLRGEHGSAYIPPSATGTVFTDVTVSTPYAAFIEQLFAEGITSGCGGGNYCPSSPVTRAEMAVLLVRTFNLP
ncbi:MAG: S8 family serine peptidase [Chloroflexi bacterium]|nr:S8 family serine peptidase [Chloroflexota bacterium]